MGSPLRSEAKGFGIGITIDGIGAAQILVPQWLAITALDLLSKADRGELEIAAEAETAPGGDPV